jgi:hypothetical protein
VCLGQWTVIKTSLPHALPSSTRILSPPPSFSSFRPLRAPCTIDALPPSCKTSTLRHVTQVPAGAAAAPEAGDLIILNVSCSSSSSLKLSLYIEKSSTVEYVHCHNLRSPYLSQLQIIKECSARSKATQQSVHNTHNTTQLERGRNTTRHVVTLSSLDIHTGLEEYLKARTGSQ